jgi:hypothetical protein
MRTPIKIAAGIAAALVLTAGALEMTGGTPEPAAAVVADHGDAGDKQVLTTFDGAMVRTRAAIGLVPRKGANQAHIKAEMQALAKREKIGTLTEASFAVFKPELLELMVPEITFVLPEKYPLTRTDAFMRDFQPDDVAFFVVQPVLVHDITFAVVPAFGVSPAAVRDRVDYDGILYDELNHYVATVQPAGLTVRYFGAVLSDKTIASVRQAMGSAAQVPADRVQVAPNLPGPGVELDYGVPNLLSHGAGHHG